MLQLNKNPFVFVVNNLYLFSFQFSVRRSKNILNIDEWKIGLLSKHWVRLSKSQLFLSVFIYIYNLIENLQ